MTVGGRRSGDVAALSGNDDDDAAFAFEAFCAAVAARSSIPRSGGASQAVPLDVRDRLQDAEEGDKALLCAFCRMRRSRPRSSRKERGGARCIVAARRSNASKLLRTKKRPRPSCGTSTPVCMMRTTRPSKRFYACEGLAGGVAYSDTLRAEAK